MTLQKTFLSVTGMCGNLGICRREKYGYMSISVQTEFIRDGYFVLYTFLY